MPIKLQWKPVLQALALKDYHPGYGDEKIMVCVNPPPEFWGDYARLRDEYAERHLELKRLALQAQNAPEDDPARQQATEYDQACSSWVQDVFLPGINDWYARLWSFGPETFTAEDLAEFNRVDPHFLTWAKVTSMSMIDAHASARKKA